MVKRNNQTIQKVNIILSKNVNIDVRITISDTQILTQNQVLPIRNISVYQTHKLYLPDNYSVEIFLQISRVLHT